MPKSTTASNSVSGTTADGSSVLRWLVSLPPLPTGLLTAALLGSMFGLAALLNAQAQLLQLFSSRQAIGAMLMLTLLPAYLCGMFLITYQGGRQLFAELAPFTPLAVLQTAENRFHSQPPLLWLIFVTGTGFGLWQNRFLLSQLRDGLGLAPLDWVFLSTNALLWALVLTMLYWKLHQSLALKTLGRAMNLALFAPQRARPIARHATLDVLLVAGSLALSPLQALDGEFREENFFWAVSIGVPAAICLFLLPLLGVRAQLLALRAARLKELHTELEARRGAPTIEVEALCAHLERVERHSPWPIDLRLIGRIFAYGVLPPLAWVAAAYVERGIDALSG